MTRPEVAAQAVARGLRASGRAEFVMKELARRAGRTDILVESAALHTDEIGCSQFTLDTIYPYMV